MEILAQAGTGLLLLLVGGAAGALVAGGVVALTVGLGITERFIGITHTAKAGRLLHFFATLSGGRGKFPDFSILCPNSAYFAARF